MGVRYIQIAVAEEDFRKIKRAAFEQELTLSEWMLLAANTFLNLDKNGKEKKSNENN